MMEWAIKNSQNFEDKIFFKFCSKFWDQIEDMARTKKRSPLCWEYQYRDRDQYQDPCTKYKAPRPITRPLSRPVQDRNHKQGAKINLVALVRGYGLTKMLVLDLGWHNWSFPSTDWANFFWTFGPILNILAAQFSPEQNRVQSAKHSVTDQLAALDQFDLVWGEEEGH